MQEASDRWTCLACDEANHLHQDTCHKCGKDKPKALSFASLEDEFEHLAKLHAAEQDGYPALTPEQIQDSDMMLARFLWWLPYEFGLKNSMQSKSSSELPADPTVIVEFSADPSQATLERCPIIAQRIERELCSRNLELYSGFWRDDNIFETESYVRGFEWIRSMQASWVGLEERKLYQSRVYPFVHDNVTLEQSIEENGVWNELKGKADVILIKDLLCACPQNGTTCGGICAGNAAQFMRALSHLLVDEGSLVVYQNHYASAVELGPLDSLFLDPAGARDIQQGRDLYFTQVDVTGAAAERVQIWKPKRPSRSSAQDALRGGSQQVEVHEQEGAPQVGRRCSFQ